MRFRTLITSFRGLGVGTTPSALITHGINTTIVEIDPKVHDYATQYFGLPPDHISVIQDATIFVGDSEAAGSGRNRYDYIIHDVFTGGAEPADLFTAEFFQGLSSMLTTDGVIAIVSKRVYDRLGLAITAVELCW